MRMHRRESYPNSIVICKYMERVVSYLKEKGAKVSKWEVIPRSEKKKQLELQAA